MPGPDLSGCLQPVLARTAVRYVGEPLAVVVGEDPYACEDAAELIEIDISERTVVLDARTAESPPAAELTRGYGDVEAAFAAAPHVVRIELAVGRHSGVPLEPRCLLAVPDPDTGALDIFGMTKVPVFNRDLLARLLGLDETLIHVHGVDAGGELGEGGVLPGGLPGPVAGPQARPPGQVGRTEPSTWSRSTTPASSTTASPPPSTQTARSWPWPTTSRTTTAPTAALTGSRCPS